MSANGIGSEQVQRFAEDGYLILEELIDPEVVELALRIAKEDPGLVAEIKDNKNYEGEGGMDTRLIYRAELTDDVFGALARSAEAARPKLLVITHVLHYAAPVESALTEVQALYDGEIVLADDLDVF